jgi:hypothetical protein
VKAATVATPPQAGGAQGPDRPSRGRSGLSTGVGRDISAQIAARKPVNRP